ncbi:MAG TPA: 2-hydroxyacyl-CoA dehydratase [Dehalococcoidia bacterium]|nr:2-hydroxyacyl-CoA dehydratase [Dehalococcoidia bacterium]
MEDERLTIHLRDRPQQLREAKKQGAKIIGYFPGNYVPEEIIYAAGAVPVCLVDGGSAAPAEAALELIPQVSCPFARAQLGERLLKKNPYYEMLDMLVAPLTCQHLKKVAEIWEYLGDMEIFKLGVPHQYYGVPELEYYTDRLKTLQNKMQTLTGNRITNENISNAIGLYNRMRELLKKISLLRRSSPPAISARDFARLNHASFYADPAFMVDFLDSVYQELSQKPPAGAAEAPRLMLVGPNLAKGDYEILELVEAAGGDIVVEEVDEGIRYYWQNIETEGDLLHSLAKGYLQDKLPAAFMRYSSQKRLDFVLKLAEDFNVSGIIWYELLYCETYDNESYFFDQKMGERNIPMLILESGYDEGGTGPMKIRIDAFIELVKGGIK